MIEEAILVAIEAGLRQEGLVLSRAMATPRLTGRDATLANEVLITIWDTGRGTLYFTHSTATFCARAPRADRIIYLADPKCFQKIARFLSVAQRSPRTVLPTGQTPQDAPVDPS